MKQLKFFFLLLPLSFGIGHKVPDEILKRAKDNGVLLVYSGTIEAMDIAIHLEIDSLVGVRYDVVLEKGNNVLSHVALFYRFSDPQKTVLYNFGTHQSITNNCCGTTGGDAKWVPVGTGGVDNYNCTHVQNVHYNQNQAEDYWVSTDVPGYSLLLKILNNISPAYKEMFIDSQIFKWGGLVKMTIASGGQMIAGINLSEANPAMHFPATDFNVPSK